ncbi:nucleoside diphosphate kinase [Sporosarcina newyorkensis 2681]|uniref:Nucleoside diphosphate kinase n=1 Tax=Sporosarcina newyorkensis 2681 TaxID=1027292 RepID=F9DTF3_9BACL|nr:nucleoside diphosphate kinase [Sporosarcina newyorkensis 2681]
MNIVTRSCIRYITSTLSEVKASGVRKDPLGFVVGFFNKSE